MYPATLFDTMTWAGIREWCVANRRIPRYKNASGEMAQMLVAWEVAGKPPLPSPSPQTVHRAATLRYTALAA